MNFLLSNRIIQSIKVLTVNKSICLYNWPCTCFSNNNNTKIILWSLWEILKKKLRAELWSFGKQFSSRRVVLELYFWVDLQYCDQIPDKFFYSDLNLVCYLSSRITSVFIVFLTEFLYWIWELQVTACCNCNWLIAEGFCIGLPPTAGFSSVWLLQGAVCTAGSSVVSCKDYLGDLFSGNLC